VKKILSATVFLLLFISGCVTTKARFAPMPADALEMPFEEPFAESEEVGCPTHALKSIDMFFLQHIAANIWLYEIRHSVNGYQSTVIVLEYPYGFYLWNTDIVPGEWYATRKNKITLLTLAICKLTRLPIF